MREGHHSAFLLLGQGPLAFGYRLMALLTLQKSDMSATDSIEQRIVVLQELMQRVAVAVAEVHAAAGAPTWPGFFGGWGGVGLELGVGGPGSGIFFVWQ